MWHAPEGETTFTGPYALMLARGIRSMADEFEDDLNGNGDYFGSPHNAFDCLTTEQKVSTLHKVAFGLLDEQTPIQPLTAFLEAAIASIFRQLEGEVDMEIDFVAQSQADMENDPVYAYASGKSDRDRYYFWRNTLLVPYNMTGANSPENLEDDEQPLTVESEDGKAWRWTTEVLEGSVLWDGDYDMDIFDDMEPGKGAELRTLFTIDDEYYSTIPDDPKRPEVDRLLKEIAVLCDRVIDREERALKRNSPA